MTRALPRRWESLALAGLVLAAVAGWALVPTYPDYDAYHHLVWGRDLLAGERPGFDTFAAPTQHPLYLALAAALSLAGDGADRLLVLVAILSLVALVAGSFALGRTLFGVAPALAGALFVGSSFAFLLYAVRAFVDVPFLALVVWAAALEARRPRRGPEVALLLAAAGLLRPEAWVLAGLYWLWCWPAASRLRRLVLLDLALLAPLAWVLVDYAVTGEPLFSLTHTSDLSAQLDRERGLANVPAAFGASLADLARPPVAAAGALGLVLAVRRFGWRAMVVPLALIGTGVLTFVALGVAGLPLIQRYLTVPAVALCLLAGYALLGYTTLPAGALRERWRLAAAGGLALGVAFVVVQASSVAALRAELRFIESTHAQLTALLDDPRARRCEPLTFPTYRLVPDVRWLAQLDADQVRSRAQDPSRAGVAVYIAGDARFARRFGRADGVDRATNRPPPGPSFGVGPFRVHSSC